MINKLSAILKYQLPEFIREDHHIFVAFVQAYYSFLEKDGNVLSFIQQFEQNQDVDLASDEFIDQFIRELAVTFPKNILIDKSQLLKIIREFYVSKGAEQSFHFLFTILYNTKIDIQYPKVFLHKSSDGKYESNDFAFITGNNIFKVDFESDELAADIKGVTSGAKAVIDSVVITFFQNQKILKLDISSYQGVFHLNEDILLTVNGVTVQETMYSVINDITITNGGKNYEITDAVTITDTGSGERAKAKITRLSSGSIDTVTITNAGTGYVVGEYIGSNPVVGSQGYAFLAKIYSVDGTGAITAVQIINEGHNYSKKTTGFVKNSGGTGAILGLNGTDIGKVVELEVFDSGINYSTPGTISANITSTSGTGAVLTPVLGGVFNEPKMYTNQDDFPSNYSRIQDSYYYQQFSYVIQSSISPHKWLGNIRSIAHPAGMQLFGSLLITSEFDISIMLADTVAGSLATTVKFFKDIDIPNHPIYDDDWTTLIFEDDPVCSLDLTMKDLDEMKFFNTFNWNIETFKDYTIADVITPCQTIIPYMQGAEIKTNLLNDLNGKHGSYVNFPLSTTVSLQGDVKQGISATAGLT